MVVFKCAVALHPPHQQPQAQHPNVQLLPGGGRGQDGLPAQQPQHSLALLLGQPDLLPGRDYSQTLLRELRDDNSIVGITLLTMVFIYYTLQY